MVYRKRHTIGFNKVIKMIIKCHPKSKSSIDNKEIPIIQRMQVFYMEGANLFKCLCSCSELTHVTMKAT